MSQFQSKAVNIYIKETANVDFFGGVIFDYIKE